jgi:hypothetical protein
VGWEGYLTLDGTEIINVSRTEAYASHDRAPWFKPVHRNPYLRTLLGHEGYTTPDMDDAPWYDEDAAESANFWGVYPLSLDGIDSSSRVATITEFLTPGGSPGRTRHAVKTIVCQCVLIGADEMAVEYGMRWLRRATMGAVASARLADSTTLGATLGYLSVAPDLDITVAVPDTDDDTVFLDGGDAFEGGGDEVPITPSAALREFSRYLRSAKVVDGPTVLRKRSMSGPCGGEAWVVTFTVAAGDPYEYGEEQVVLQGYMDPDVTDPWSPDLAYPGTADTAWASWEEIDCGVASWQPIYDPLCGNMIVPPAPPSIPLGCYNPPDDWNRRRITIPAENIPLWGDLVPQLTVYSATGLRGLRIRWYEDPDGTFDPDDNPCDFIGDWVVSYIEPGGTLIVDSVAQQVRYITSLGRVRRADTLVFQHDSTPIIWPRLTGGFGYVMTLDLPLFEDAPVVDLSLVPKAAA